MDFDKYKNKIQCPARPSKPHLSKDDSSKQAKDYVSSLEQWEDEMNVFYEERAKFNYEEAKILEMFKKDVLEEYGILKHPKADMLYSIAWEHGHAYGFYEVENWINTLSCLLK